MRSETDSVAPTVRKVSVLPAIQAFNSVSPRPETSRIRLRILLPFTLLLAFVMSVFLITTYIGAQRDREADLGDRAKAAERLFQHELAADTQMMHGVLDAVTADPSIKEVFLSGDREALSRRVKPLFESLRRDHGITHFYFSGPDRVTMLRMHRPDFFGDVIDRVTTLRAARTRRITHGLELGPLGTLTLRTVMPWQVDGRLIGFVELGHEIGHFVSEIHDILALDVVVLVYKKYLRYTQRKSAPGKLKSAWPWDRFKTMVALAATLPEVPAPLARLFEAGKHAYDTVVPIDEGGGKRVHVAFLSLDDAAGREIGDLVVIRDVTDEERAFRNSMLATTGISLLAGAAVLVLFLITLRRVEHDYRRKREVEGQFTRLSNEHERIVQVEKLSAVGTMVGEVAHQVNNPLVGVINMAQLAKRELDDPERARHLLDDIIAAGRHCHDFVNRMVEFVRASSSEVTPTEIGPLVRETIELFRQSARQHPKVGCELPARSVTLDVDPIMIRHALFNLLNNAAQAQARGGRPGARITIRVVARRNARDGAPGWAFIVEDQGPGLAQEVRVQMLTPFFTTRPDGTGLGLPVVQYVAHLHGGEISGENRDPVGARFTLWLPDRHAPDEDRGARPDPR